MKAACVVLAAGLTAGIYLLIAGGLAAVFIGLPLLLAWGLTKIARRTKQCIVALLGVRAQLYCGALGIVVHEASHLVAALLFRHRIDEFRLIVAPWRLGDGALGYVNHSWNKNSHYQNLGNVVIGIAPIFGCTLVLRGLAMWLVPAWYSSAVTVFSRIVSFQFNHGTILLACKLLYGYHIISWQGCVLVVLSVSIALGGFDLSASDFKTTTSVIGIVAVVIISGLWLALLLGAHGVLVAAASDYASWLLAVVSLSFVWSLLAYLMCYIVSLMWQ